MTQEQFKSAYTIIITDPDSPHVGERGRMKDRSTETPYLYLIQLEGGERIRCFRDQFEDEEPDSWTRG